MKKWGLYYHKQYGYGIVVDTDRKKGTAVVNFNNDTFKPVLVNQSDFDKKRYN